MNHLNLKLNWAEINNGSYGEYNTSSPIKSKTLVLKASLCDYSNAYILVKGTITVWDTGTAEAPDNNKKR